MKDHIPFYVEFAVNQTEEQVIKDVVNCLNINIKIWESHEGFKKEIEFEPEKHKSPLMMYLLYSRDDIPQDDVHNANAHYDAIVLKKNPNTDSDTKYITRPRG